MRRYMVVGTRWEAEKACVLWAVHVYVLSRSGKKWQVALSNTKYHYGPDKMGGGGDQQLDSGEVVGGGHWTGA